MDTNKHCYALTDAWFTEARIDYGSELLGKALGTDDFTYLAARADPFNPCCAMVHAVWEDRERDVRWEWDGEICCNGIDELNVFTHLAELAADELRYLVLVR